MLTSEYLVVQMAIEEIANWLFNHFDDKGGEWVLTFGIWSVEDFPHTYYATVNQQDGGLIGETTYGSDTIEESLTLLVKELP